MCDTYQKTIENLRKLFQCNHPNGMEYNDHHVPHFQLTKWCAGNINQLS